MEDILKEIETYCKLADIALFYGSLENEESASYFRSSNETRHEDFLEQARQLGCRMIVAQKDYFNFDEYYNEEEESESILRYRKYQGRISILKIYYNLEGVVYLHEKSEKWFIDFQQELEERDELVQTERNLYKSEKDAEREHLYEIAETIAQEEWFFRIHTRTGEAMGEIAHYTSHKGMNFNDDQIKSICYRAKVQLLMKYNKIQGARLKAQIKELLDAKMSKVKIVSQLGITHWMFEKYG